MGQGLVQRSDGDQQGNKQLPQNQPGPQDATAVSEESRILTVLFAKNEAEIAAGKLAQRKGNSQAVKDFGGMLVQDHTANQQQVRDVASQMGIMLDKADRPAATPDPLAHLESLDGAAFDSAFARQMSEGHAEVIAEVERSIKLVKDGSVRQLLESTLPALKKHKETADSLPDSSTYTPKPVLDKPSEKPAPDMPEPSR